MKLWHDEQGNIICKSQDLEEIDLEGGKVNGGGVAGISPALRFGCGRATGVDGIDGTARGRTSG